MVNAREIPGNAERLQKKIQHAKQLKKKATKKLKAHNYHDEYHMFLRDYTLMNKVFKYILYSMCF